MTNIIVSIIISATVFIGGMFGYENFVFPNYGTTLTTINGGDKITDSRTVINDNFTALEASKLDKTATTLPSSFLASSLTSLGTIASGIWNGTAIGVGYGGTGTTSPTTHYVMLGNGASGLKVVSGLGTSGQFLTSNGAGASPTWQSATVNQGDNYTWTGTHSFTATTTIAASSSTNNALVLNGLNYKFPSSHSSNGNLVNDGTGNLSWSGILFNHSPGTLLLASSTVPTGSKTNTYVKYNEFEISSYATGTVSIKTYGSSTDGHTCTYRVYRNGVAIGTENATTATSISLLATEDIIINPSDLIQIYIKESGGDAGCPGYNSILSAKKESTGNVR